MDFALFGMVIIVIAWAVQFLHTSKKGPHLSHTFLILYGAGVLGIIVNSIGATYSAASWLNIITLLLVVLMLIKLHK